MKLGREAGCIKVFTCHSKDFRRYCEYTGEPRDDFKDGVLPQVTHLFNNASLLKTIDLFKLSSIHSFEYAQC